MCFHTNGGNKHSCERVEAVMQIAKTFACGEGERRESVGCIH